MVFASICKVMRPFEVSTITPPKETGAAAFGLNFKERLQSVPTEYVPFSVTLCALPSPYTQAFRSNEAVSNWTAPTTENGAYVFASGLFAPAKLKP